MATEHRRILGQDEKVLQLIKATHDSALADDNQLRNALKNVGIKVVQILIIFKILFNIFNYFIYCVKFINLIILLI